MDGAPTQPSNRGTLRRMSPLLRARARAQGLVFTAADAVACGYNPDEASRLVRSGQWVRLRRGVYCERVTLEAAATPEARHRVMVAAALLAAGTRVHASHQSAAVLHEVAVLRVPSRVTLTAPDGPHKATPALLRVVAALPQEHCARTPDGLAVTSVARAVVDIARALPFRDAVVAADSALHAGRTTPAELQTVLDEQRGWRGSRSAARVLAFADKRAESPGESVTRVLLAELGYTEVEPQPVLEGLSRRTYRVDLLLRGRVIVEFDGKVKYVDAAMTKDRTPADVLLAEKDREQDLEDAGYEVVRLKWSDLAAPARVRAKIEAALARTSYQRAAPPTRQSG